jgi:superkiller protein 3
LLTIRSRPVEIFTWKSQAALAQGRLQMSDHPPSRNYGKSDLIRAWLFSLAFVLACPLLVLAQGSGRSSVGTGGNHIVQGYIFFPSGRRAEGQIQVKLQSYAASEIMVTADTSGSFTFSSLAPGNYTIVVDAGEHYEIARENVFIDTDLNMSRSGIPTNNASRRYTVMVHLQPKVERGQAKPAVVNATLAVVPENARKLYEKGMELSRAGETAKAIDSIKGALSIYPKFPLALNELGVQYLKAGMPQKAAEVLNSAVKLDPEAFTPRLNLGIALLEVKQFEEAQVQLNEAVKRNASAPTPHMYLGLTLAHLNSFDQAEQEFLRAIEVGGNNMGLAHYYLGGLYWKRRDYGRAVEQLEKYLELTPNASDSERVRGTIKELRKKL